MISKRKVLAFFGLVPVAAVVDAGPSIAAKEDGLYIGDVKVFELYQNEKGEHRLSLCVPLWIWIDAPRRHQGRPDRRDGYR